MIWLILERAEKEGMNFEFYTVILTLLIQNLK